MEGRAGPTVHKSRTSEEEASAETDALEQRHGKKCLPAREGVLAESGGQLRPMD